MKVYRIYLTSWTASFRYPNLISGFQPTLPVPPLSTVHGLISAALGSYYAPEKPEVGFVFQTAGVAVDLETIYQIKIASDEVIPNVIRREFLFDNHLWIYTQTKQIADAFRRPFFQLLLGRSSDLATVHDIAEIEVEPCNKLTKLKGTIVPFGKYVLAAAIQSLPMNFSNTIPRRNLGTKPYYLLESKYRQAKTQPILANGFVDCSNRFFEKQNGVEVYWQE